ncbi:gliding motility protein GldC [Flavobacteriales bacterium]|nr:gliding motility protein GldC [Flavobacteriales bacterium]
MATKKTSEIKINVITDENNIPHEMNWTASDAKINNKECKAMILSVWDKEDKAAMRMDLWTKEMMVDEMKMFFYQTLVTMADNFQKATGEDEIVEDLRDYCTHFADKMKLEQMK